MSGKAGPDWEHLFASLVEKEKLKGHHSAEGRAIRTLSRAMNGWSGGALSRADAMILCRQAIEDWLKARLGIPWWSQAGLLDIIERAVCEGVISTEESRPLRSVHRFCTGLKSAPSKTIGEVQPLSLLRDIVCLIEKRW